MSVDLKLSSPITVGTPRPLFALPRGWFYVPLALADGRRFLFSTTTADLPPATINVVVNWAAGLNNGR